MATITIRREYEDGEILFGSDIDAIIEDIETFLNTTRINDDNIQNAGITASDKLVDATVTASKLASNAVTTTKIMDANVTTAKIADSNVTTAKIADSNVTTAKIADSNVTTAKIADVNVTAAKLATDAVETAKIKDANVTTGKLADSAVTAAKIADNTITRIKLTGGTTSLSGSLSAGGASASTGLGSYTFSGRPCLVVVYAGSLGTGSAATTFTLSISNVGTVFSKVITSTAHDFSANVSVAYFNSPTSGSQTITLSKSAGGFSTGSASIAGAIIEL